MKRFLYFWRLPILFFILFFVLLFLSASLEGDAAGAVGALWLFVDIPCLVFFTIRAIVLRIRSAVEYRRTGVKVEDYNFPEANFVMAIVDGIGSVGKLSSNMKLRYFLFKILGIILIAGGIVGCFFFFASMSMIVLFTLVMIGGATLCIMANPRKYNLEVGGARMVPFHGNLTEEDLYDYLRTIPTSLGYPRFAIVRGFKKPILVYGTDADAFIQVVYRARHFEYFNVSSVSSMSLIEFLPTSDEPYYGEKDASFYQDSDFSLDEITSAVEQAVSLAEADEE